MYDILLLLHKVTGLLMSVTPTNEKTGNAETDGQVALESDSDRHTTKMSDVEVGVPE